MGITIRDVAEEASVSATTVSRVFNHDHLVNSETREHVERGSAHGLLPERHGPEPEPGTNA
ncbi:MAG TPA: LacI family DNA-binding transcriptional regulator, partial [Salinibacter sp.]|nr:LacI family DNA-binding transcriptional regulator [Salinibacter sp.]